MTMSVELETQALECDLTCHELVTSMQKYNSKADVALVEEAYNFSKRAHEGQLRMTGEPYFNHPKRIAQRLLKLKADSQTIAAALLHDVVEDCGVKEETIREKFGEDVLQLIEGLTKISNIKFKTKEAYKAENIRKVVLATTKDVRIIIIKLVDRLDNMKTIGVFRPEKQQRIANETLEIYAPIAHKLGMNAVKRELEDLSLRFLEPEIYQEFKNKINKKRSERVQEIKKITQLIQDNLKKNDIEADISGRAKSFYSIYKKMKEKGKNFNQIYDLNAIRIITQEVPTCYQILGIVHSLYKPIPGKFKDYISVPKSNGYQSLHTVVFGEHGRILEIQIRTLQMHREAEEGIAAHWRYKGTDKDKLFDKKITWLKEILEWMRESGESSDFLETLKVDLFKDEVVVFTPKGDPIFLPETSCPIDFAYKVHTAVGNTLSKAKVNGNIVPLNYELRSGDVIEIITARNAKPSRQWMKFVKTTQARSAIRHTLSIASNTDVRKLEGQESRKIKHLLDKIEGNFKVSEVKFSQCCNPQYLDPIVALRTKENKIAVHKKGCPNIHAMMGGRPVEMYWKKPNPKYVKQVILNVPDRVGMLATILNLVSKVGINIKSVNTDSRKDHVRITFSVEFMKKAQEKELVDILKSEKQIMNFNVLESKEELTHA